MAELTPEELFKMGETTAHEIGALEVGQPWGGLDPQMKEWMTALAGMVNERLRQAEAAARAEEREACIEIAREHQNSTGKIIANTIRARGESE